MALAHHDWRLSQSIVDQARAAGVTITTAESCTGGLVSVALTSVPGSSSVFDRSFIT
ncbi:MAG: CinA family protein, partial [Pseudomonadota bacterium]